MARAAREGDEVVEVTCHRETVLVAAGMRAGWRCGRDGGRGVDGRRFVLGPGGALPPPEARG